MSAKRKAAEQALLINARLKHLLCETPPEEEAELKYFLLSSGGVFLNKSLFSNIHGIAFCHNFSPFVDPSAYVASRRLGQLTSIVGKEINWHVFHACLHHSTTDEDFDLFFSKFHFSDRKQVLNKAYWDEEFQFKWGEEAANRAEEVKNVQYIYSRSMWIGSHIAALKYKKKHPEVFWFAEFSDPISKNVFGTDREISSLKIRQDSPDFYKELERSVIDGADQVIFTNENQKLYMLEYTNCGKNLAKCLSLPHPILKEEYLQVHHSNYRLCSQNINLAFFGSIYKNRDLSFIRELLNYKDVCLHLFIPKAVNLDDFFSYEEQKKIKRNDFIPYLEFLNLASKMDYLLLNDVSYPKDKLNPYLPSKLSDYLAAGKKILAFVNPNTPLDNFKSEKIIKIKKIEDLDKIFKVSGDNK
ncbi:hypothetical protein [Turicimonas muris]|uniref:hypothetical protein n=1 Tax=Turicimonas muris TaxID=1796652 RepID=UPI0032B294E2